MMQNVEPALSLATSSVDRTSRLAFRLHILKLANGFPQRQQLRNLVEIVEHLQSPSLGFRLEPASIYKLN